MNLRKGLFLLFLLLPLVTAALPDLETHYEEDAVLLGLFLFLVLRMLNPERRSIPIAWQWPLFTISTSLVYGILWLGVVRGYLDLYGRWLVWFPASLGLAVGFRPTPLLPETRFYILLRSCMAWSMVIGFGTVLICAQIFHIESARSIIPGLFLLPIVYCLLLICWIGVKLERGFDHLPWVVLVGLIAFPAWYQNAYTWLLWYSAGAEERSWTPFQYDRPKEIQEAEKKPYAAARLYYLVYQRIENKGFLPHRLNWPFFMKYRMAVQAMRKQDAVTCARFLPPSQVNQPDKIRLLKELWHSEFLWNMQRGEPDFSLKNQIMVDLAMNPERTAAYALDRWGRVYSFVNGELWREWEPEIEFNDAVDLEIFHDTFIILRSNGSLITSKPIAEVPVSLPTPPPGQSWLRLKKFHSSDGFMAITDYGETVFLGELPEGFRAFISRVFTTPAVADVEIDPDEIGYYQLDIFGAVHAIHPTGSPSIPCTSPPVPKSLLPYWDQIPMAVDLELDPLKRGMYIYTREGEVYSLAETPYKETYRPTRKYPKRGVALGARADGRLYALESNGNLIQIP